MTDHTSTQTLKLPYQSPAIVKNTPKQHADAAPKDQVLALFNAGASDEKVMQTLVGLYQERLYWHIRKMVIDHDDTDDLLQNVFIKAWKGLPDFRQDAQLYTWLYTIASNECITFLNKKRKYFFVPIHDIQNELKHKIDNSLHISGTGIEIALQKALLTLPDKQRMVFNMKYFDDLTYEQIAQIVGTSVGALKASYHIAVKKIEKFITK